MVIERHPQFEVPQEDESIWKFMDFPKFVHILDSKGLYFNRSDKFKDPFEGMLSNYNEGAWPEVYKEWGNGTELSPNTIKVFKQSDQLKLRVRQEAFVSCWHINKYESAAMWDLYTKAGYGIAIKSTYGKLRRSFIGDQHPSIIGNIKYIDYQNEWMSEGNIYYPIFHKRRSFVHENELRVLYHDETKNLLSDNYEESDITGVSLGINLNSLIETIYVSPDSPGWMADLIRSIKNKYEVAADVIHSDLFQIS